MSNILILLGYIVLGLIIFYGIGVGCAYLLALHLYKKNLKEISKLNNEEYLNKYNENKNNHIRKISLLSWVGIIYWLTFRSKISVKNTLKN